MRTAIQACGQRYHPARFPAFSGGVGSCKDDMKKNLYSLLIATIALSQYACASPKEESVQGHPAASNSSIKFLAQASTPTSPTSFFDYEFAWDEFDHRGSTVWACRGVQTEKFVDRELCKGREKVDGHWPGKTVPSTWRAE